MLSNYRYFRLNTLHCYKKQSKGANLMNASETRLQQIIEGTKQYVVPLFQRTYSWDKKEWETLWNDLAELCDSDNPRTHFMGSLVTMPTTSVPEGVAKYLLIDGQQRLTTTFIILALMRDYAKQINEPELAEEINNTLLVNQYKKDTDYFKLLPTQADRVSFQSLVKPIGEREQDQIQNAYNFFEKKFRQHNPDIRKLMKIVTSNLSVVSIVLDPDDNPHLVFESLNAKGRPLTQSDLIRNFFFMRIHINEQENIYSNYWEPMQKALGDNLTEFIRHYLMRDGVSVKQNDVYFRLKESINHYNAFDYLKELSRFAGYYQRLLHPIKEKHSGIQKMLSKLNRLEVTTAYPFLLNCYEYYATNSLTADEFISVLKILENFIIRRFICNVPTNQLNKIFPSLYGQVSKKDSTNFVEGLKNVLQTKGYPKDGEFLLRLKDVKLYGSGDRAIKTKLILETIEESYNHKEQAPFDTLSIEHVMPQTLPEYWQMHLGEDWEIIHELYLHTLGNLTLTAYNTELSNDDYETKRNLLIDSHLEINKYFKDYSTWKKEDIEKRTEHLSQTLLSIWTYFGDEKNEVNNKETVTGTTPNELWILGQYFVVNSWRDVLQQTMNTIADLEPEKFEQIIQEFPRFVGRDKKKFRAIRELNNGAFVEVNLSAQSIQRFCFQAVEAIDLSYDDWRVITE